MVAYTLFFLGQALAPNIETLLVTRFWGGFFAVAPLTIAGGVIADMWSAAGRGPATSLFSASVFLGPGMSSRLSKDLSEVSHVTLLVMGPVIGGFVAQTMWLKWNWIFWIMMIFAGACTVVTIAVLPETYAPIILLKKVNINILSACIALLTDLARLRSFARKILRNPPAISRSTKTKTGQFEVFSIEPFLDHSSCLHWSLYSF